MIFLSLQNSGGTYFTVKGKDLDTVQEPILLFYDASSGIQKRATSNSDYGVRIESPVSCLV